MSKIQAGSVVRLNSGGPLMTVAFVREGEARVNWFTQVNVSKSEKFDVEQLHLPEGLAQRVE